jgi:ribosome biogenesis GTPase / thiamine phosphate phosphatase
VFEAATLESLGWTPVLAEAAALAQSKETGLVPARVIAQLRERWFTAGPAGVLSADLRGILRKPGTPVVNLPGVGDWVMIRPRAEEGRATIHAVLPRRTVLVRKVAGVLTEGQVLAANVDTVFVVVPLDGEINQRRVQRQISIATEGGAACMVVATKADVATAGAIESLEEAADATPVWSIAAPEGKGLEPLMAALGSGATVALLGVSGAGKSTLTNVLLGTSHMDTAAVRVGDSKGRHTTSHRELVLLPSGAMLIDTPGLREAALWTVDTALKESFADIDELSESCRFTNCEHRTEPGCELLSAIKKGKLTRERVESWRKLYDEIDALAFKQKEREAAQNKRPLHADQLDTSRSKRRR